MRQVLSEALNLPEDFIQKRGGAWVVNIKIGPFSSHKEAQRTAKNLIKKHSTFKEQLLLKKNKILIILLVPFVNSKVVSWNI